MYYITSVNTLPNKPDTNSERSKVCRENKNIGNANLTMCNSRALRLKFDKPNYNEEIRISVIDTPGMGKGVQADADIPPASTLCAYAGKPITSYRTIQRLLRDGNDKILQVGDQRLWLDGQSSTTLGPMFNHACDCVANCKFDIDRDNVYICTKASAAGDVKKDDLLTVNYGYGNLTNKSLKDVHLRWYVEYCRTHICKSVG